MRVDVIAAPVDDGVHVALEVDGEPSQQGVLRGSELVDLVSRHPEARWVWPSTASCYRPLLRVGARVSRCHDLRLSARILQLAHPEAEAPPGWLTHDEPVEADQHAPHLPLEGLLAADVEPDQVRAEHARQQRLAAAGDEPGRMRLLLAAESAGALIAEEMRHDGVPWSRHRHEAILAAALGPRPSPGYRPVVLQRLATQIAELLGAPHLNPDSPVELLRTLRSAGLDVTSTSKWDLARNDHPVVAPLLEYKKLARLLSANGWTWLDSWVQPGSHGRTDRFRTDYVPGGVVTGRWATNGGGALQIPKSLRAAVVADPGWRLVVADAAQIEPRVLAAMSRDADLVRAGTDLDLYAGLVAAGVVDTRQRAKVGMLGALYGGTAGESGVVLPRLRQAYPRALGLVDDAARTGERGGTVRTWLGRTSPPPGAGWRDAQHAAAVVEATDGDERRARTQARSWGRFTRNFVVQGTAAEWALCWMADLRRRLRALPVVEDPDDPADWMRRPGQGRPHLVFFLHDEIIVHTPADQAEHVADEVRASATAAGRLLFGDLPITFPLDVAVVDSYDRADKADEMIPPDAPLVDAPEPAPIPGPDA